MATPVWKGSSLIQEDPDSPKLEATKEGPKYTRIFTGPYATLLAQLPARLTNMTGVPTGFFVDAILNERLPGGRGKSTITLTPSPQPDYTMAGNQVLEVEWTEVQQRIEQHKVFSSGGDWELTDADRDAVEEWKNLSTSAARGAKYLTLSDNAKHLADALRNGQDSYIVFSPVVKRTTKYATAPAVNRCGFVDTPPGIAPSGYNWLKTADRLSQDRTFTREEEWTGAYYWDPVFYAPP